MASPAVASKFRAVLCRHCAKPIRVPALIMKKESEFQSLTDSSDIHYHLISRVFNVRHRAQGRSFLTHHPSKEKQERILPAPLLLTFYNPHQQNEGRFSITPSEFLRLPTCQLDSIPAIRASSKPSPEAKYVRSPTPCLIRPTAPHAAPA